MHFLRVWDKLHLNGGQSVIRVATMYNANTNCFTEYSVI